jgi:hypothetical protein
VRLECSLRFGAAAGTGSAIVATKRETFRTDALQVRKRNPPTQINAGSDSNYTARNDNALDYFHIFRSSIISDVSVLIGVGKCLLRT